MDESYGNKFDAPKPPSVLEGLNAISDGGIEPIPLYRPHLDMGYADIPKYQLLGPRDFRRTGKQSSEDDWEEVASVKSDWEEIASTTKHDWGTEDTRDKKVDKTQIKSTLSSYEKAQLAAEKGFASLPITGRNDGFRELQQARNIMTKMEQNPWFTTEENLAEVQKLQKQGIDKLASYIILRATLDKDLQQADPNFVENLWGGAAAGLTDPVNLLGVGNSTTLLRTLAKQFGVGFGLGQMSELAQSDYDKGLGLRKDSSSMKELLEAGFSSGTIAAALSAIFHISSKAGAKPKPNADPTTAAIETEIKSSIEQAQKQLDDAAPPVKPVEEPYPVISEEFKDADWTEIDSAQTQFADSLEPPDSVGPAEVGKKTREPKERAGALPKLDKEFKTPRPANAVESFGFEKDIEQRQPYQQPQGDVPYEPFKDVTESVESPFMSNKDVDIATTEQVAGTDNLTFPKPDAAMGMYEYPTIKPNLPKLPDDITRAQSVFAREESTIGQFIHKPKIVNELYKAKNLGDVRRVLDSVVPKEWRAIWDKAVNGMDESVEFHIFDRDPENMTESAKKMFMEEDGLHGMAGYKDNGTISQYVAITGLDKALKKNINISGLDISTIVHEIYHTRTKNALRLGLDPEKSHLFPNEKRFAETARQLWKDTVDKMHAVQKLANENKIVNLDEFITYGMSDPEFQGILKNIHLGKETVWARFVRAVKALFGIEPKDSTAFERMMDLSNQLHTITLDNAPMRAYADSGSKGNTLIHDISKNTNQLPAIVVEDLGNIKTADELMKYLGNRNLGDLGFTVIEKTPLLKDTMQFYQKYFTVTGQTERLLSHPVFTWVANRIPQIHRQAEVRIQRYKEHLSDVIALKRPDQLKLFKGLVDLNNPKHLEARKMAEEGDTRAELLKEFMPEELVPHAIKVLDVMRNIHDIERRFALEHGRNLDYQPMYFPRSHGGTFKFSVRDHTGKLLYIKGFENLRAAQHFQQLWMEKTTQQAGPPEWIVSPIERSDVGGFIDSIGDLIVLESLPDALRKQVQSIEESFDTARQRFELERAKANIGGFIGEVLYGEGDGLGRAENNRLLELLNNRIDDSYRFETRTRVIKDIAEGLLWNPEPMIGKPRLAQAVKNVVYRELGHDIALTRKLDNSLQEGFDKISESINKAVTRIHNQKLTNNISSLGPQAIHQMAQFWTFTTSLVKLAMHPPIMLVNSLAMSPFPFVAIDGTRTAFKEGVNPMIPQYAYFKTLGYVADADAAQWMHQAKLEGMIEPRAADLFHITERHDPMTKMERVVNAPRNAIEKATNFTSILYYYNYYKMARPDLHPFSEGFKVLVYRAARSWTGDYRDFSTPMYISKMGAAGRLTGNFTKWTMNQTGRLIDDVKDIRDNPAKLQAYLPLIANMTGLVLMGGLLALPGVADYEYWRYLLKKMSGGSIDMKPFSVVYDDLRKYGEKHLDVKLPEWIKRGAITAVSDEVAQGLPGGLDSGIDVSGSLRHAPMVQANTVAIEYFLDTFMAAHKASKAAWGYATEGKKPIPQDIQKMIAALPVITQPSMKHLFITQKRKDPATGEDQYIQQNKFTDEGDYARTPVEQFYGMYGFKTKKENEFNDFKEYTKWLERTTKTRIGELIAETITNIDNKKLVSKNITELLSKGGEPALRNLENQLVGKPLQRLSTYEERKIQEVLNSTDPIVKKQLIEAIRDYRASRSPKTSSSR